MKKKTFLAQLLIVLGLFVGSFALSALADFSVNKSTPPTCVSDPASPYYDEGCNTVINTGSTTPMKNGDLTVNSLLVNLNSQFSQNITIVGNLTVSSGLPSVGKFPTAKDSSGTVFYTDLSGGALPIVFSDVLNLKRFAGVNLTPGQLLANQLIDKKCSQGGICSLKQLLGKHRFCGLADREVSVTDKGTFNSGDMVSCNVYVDTVNGQDQWFLFVRRGSNTIDTGMSCQAVCWGGDAISQAKGNTITADVGNSGGSADAAPSGGGGSPSGKTYQPN